MSGCGRSTYPSSGIFIEFNQVSVVKTRCITLRLGDIVDFVASAD